MPPVLIIHILKSMLSIVILGSVLIGAYEGFAAMGIPLGASVVDFDKMLEELLKGLPHVGELMDFVFNTRGAIGGTDTVQISLLMEIVHGALLFMAFKLMHGIKKVVDQVFCSMLTYSGFLSAVIEYIEMLFLVLVSVILAGVFKSAAGVLFSRIGINTGSGLVIAVLIAGIFISCCIGKKRGAFEIIINTAFELVWGFVVVSLIYMVVLCTQILSRYSEWMTHSELIMVFSAEVIGILVLTIIGANIFAKTTSSVFNINRM